MSNLGFRLGLVLVTLPAAVLAQPVAERPEAPARVSLRYTTEAGCPSEVEFVAEVMARVRRPVTWTKSGAAVQMVVVVRRAREHASGTLEVVQPATEPTRREFNSSSCAEVGSALALVAALTLDPNARTEQLPPHASSPVPAEPPAPAPEAPAASPEAKPAAPTTPTAKPAAVVSPGFAAWLGPAASVAAGYASKPMVAVGLSLGVRSASDGFSPGFQLTPLWGGTGATGPAAEGGVFSWAMGRLEGCPLRLKLAQALNFEPCLAAEIGRVSARGADAAITPVSVDRWWFAAGATLSLHFSRGFWFARLGGLLLVPATRDEFVFRDPDRTIHQASPLLVGGSLALGFQFGS